MIEFENLAKSNFELVKGYQEKFNGLLKSGQFILGKELEHFEKSYAKFIGTKYSIGVGSGTDAISLALKSLNLPPGSEVIVPSNIFISTIFAIFENSLIPILVEPNISTYNIDPKKITEKITPNTRVILVAHLYGKCAQMDQIEKLVKNYNLYLIEDAAQAHGAKFRNKNAGNFGIGCFSFYPTKNLGGLGDGGGLTTNSAKTRDKIKALRNYGSFKKHENLFLGKNSRLDEMQAIFLSEKLKILLKINNHKRKLAKMYLKDLKEDFILPSTHKDFYDVFHIFNIRHPKRDQLQKYLLKNKIQTAIHYPIPPHHQPALKNLLKGSFPLSEKIHKTTLSLPISYFHKENDIQKVIEVLNKF